MPTTTPANLPNGEYKEQPVKGCIALASCAVLLILGLWKAAELITWCWHHFIH